MDSNQSIILANCGLVCSKCKAFIKGKCKGCHSNKPKFASCPVKKCNALNQFKTCADCKRHEDLKNCIKLNNFISKIISFFTKSNRIENLHYIRKNGYESFLRAESKDD